MADEQVRQAARERVLARIEAARLKSPDIAQDRIQRHPEAPALITANRCPLCQQPIHGMVPCQEFPDRATYAALPTRQGLRILFDDGSAHETSVCRQCAPTLTPELVDAVYCSDLLSLLCEEELTGGQQPWGVCADRLVVGFEVA